MRALDVKMRQMATRAMIKSPSNAPIGRGEFPQEAENPDKYGNTPGGDTEKRGPYGNSQSAAITTTQPRLRIRCGDHSHFV